MKCECPICQEEYLRKATNEKNDLIGVCMSCFTIFFLKDNKVFETTDNTEYYNKYKVLIMDDKEFLGDVDTTDISEW